MYVAWQDLIASLTIVALFTSVWAQISDWLDAQRYWVRKVCTGLLVGVAATFTMMLAIEVIPGVFFDLRAGIVAIGSFFSGPLVAGIALVITIFYRVAEGGAGAISGVIHLLLAAATGLGVRRLANAVVPSIWWIFVLGGVVFILVMLTIPLLPDVIPDRIIVELVLPTALLSFIATVVMGLTIRKTRQGVRERRVLRAALSQAPEFLYVKDTENRFLAANVAVSRHLGFARPADLIGKTDADFGDPQRAQQTHAEEQHIIRTGEPLLDFEEQLPGPDGNLRWYRTSKVPLRDEDGRIIGLAGVTMETTDLKQLEQELTESRDRLALALAEMSDGLAVFDAEGYLLFCNERYREAFPRSAHVRVPGAHIKDILRAVAETGEQLDVPDNDVEGWVERVGSLLRVPNVVTVELFDGSYLQLRNRPASNDTALVIVSDVTDIKRAERALIEANADLSRLASTDALTGLFNRRIFDETLARDMARTGRAGSQLSLILLDVDHFKKFNDTHGHREGDRCLIIVAHALKGCLNRPSDLAARYGGEEFAVILPDTALEGAVLVAERIREAISHASVSAIGNIGTRVTVSLGVAEYDLASHPETPDELVGRADTALYAAKAAGRNRVMTDPPATELVTPPQTRQP